MRSRPLVSLFSTLLLSATVLLAACGKHRSAHITGPNGLSAGSAGSLKSSGQVCHIDELGQSQILNVGGKALAAHLAHGDALLVDADGDGWVAAANACVPGGDCNDRDPAVNPGAPERCNGIDNDCDGLTDEASIIVGTQAVDVLRDPFRIHESAMGNLVADAMRSKYADVEAALTNSGGLRNDLLMAPPSTDENVGQITCGELFAVLPFGNRAVILTVTGAQLEQALLNGFSPSCNPSVATGRFPQVSGLKITYLCNGSTPVITGMWKTPQGIGGPEIPIGPTDTIRLVTNDFLSGGGDGYTVFQSATNVVQPGDVLLEILADYVAANSPINPVVQGRIARVTPVL